eukprot:gene6820-9338_t
MTKVSSTIFNTIILLITWSSKAHSYISRTNINSIKSSKSFIWLNNVPPSPPFPPRTFNRLSMQSEGENNTTPKFIENNSDEQDSDKDNNVFFRKWMKINKETRDDIKTTVFSFGFALLVRVLLFEPRFIPSLSMFPTFDIGDQLLVDKISKNFKPLQRRDVVVFNPPESYIRLTGNTEALIKRVVAAGGDIVEVRNNHLYVNGEIQEESYINELPQYTLPPTKVPVGMLLVLGDNRNHSFDSHIWGLLPDKNVIGRAVVKYWPPWRIGIVEGSQ